MPAGGRPDREITVGVQAESADLEAPVIQPIRIDRLGTTARVAEKDELAIVCQHREALGLRCQSHRVVNPIQTAAARGIRYALQEVLAIQERLSAEASHGGGLLGSRNRPENTRALPAEELDEELPDASRRRM